ncbi:MAG: restriction endonuclease subunit S [Muribaculaceae bacterium]|nr:restriction endonuclease subunit S [Muribaculaceae bacterium]
MNHGWEYKSWNNILKIYNGKNQKAVENPNGLYPIYGSGGIMSYADAYICPENCVIIGRKGNINNPIFVPTKFWNVDTAFGLSPKDSVHPRFLFYFCKVYDFEKHNKATTIPSLVKNDLLKINMPVPSMEVQERIVAELDKLNELIEIKRNQLKDLDTLAQSLFYETFGEPFINSKGWLTNSFGELASSINYGTSLPATDGGKYPYIRMNNLTDNGYLDLSSLKYIDIPDAELDKCLVKKGDILFNRTNSREKVGKTALFDRNEEMVIAGYIIRVRANSEILNPVFAVRYMNLPEMKEHLRKICRGAVNQANINSKEMSSIPFLVPPIELQNQYTIKIEAIEGQKRLIESSIADLETLLASRMDYWFNE